VDCLFLLPIANNPANRKWAGVLSRFSCLLSSLLLDSKGEEKSLGRGERECANRDRFPARQSPRGQAHRAFKAPKVNIGFDEVKLYTVGGQNLWIKIHVLEPAPESCVLPTPPLPRMKIFSSASRDCPDLRSDFANDVLSQLLSADLGREVIESATIEIKILQLWQDRLKRSEFSDLGTPGEI
jgi:hypothetical protein